MSWGERSCIKKHPCGYMPALHTCNVDCVGYEWDGVTKPDSIKEAERKKCHGFVSSEKLDMTTFFGKSKRKRALRQGE